MPRPPIIVLSVPIIHDTSCPTPPPATTTAPPPCLILIPVDSIAPGSAVPHIVVPSSVQLPSMLCESDPRASPISPSDMAWWMVFTRGARSPSVAVAVAEAEAAALAANQSASLTPDHMSASNLWPTSVREAAITYKNSTSYAIKHDNRGLR